MRPNLRPNFAPNFAPKSYEAFLIEKCFKKLLGATLGHSFWGVTADARTKALGKVWGKVWGKVRGKVWGKVFGAKSGAQFCNATWDPILGQSPDAF